MGDIRSLCKKRRLTKKDEAFLEDEMNSIIKKYCNECERIEPRKPKVLVQVRRGRKKGF